MSEASCEAEKESGFWHIGVLTVWVLMTIAGAIVRGLVLVQMWAWFVVPFGVVQIGTAHAFGLSLCLMYFASPSKARRAAKKCMKTSFADDVLRMFLLPMIVLCVGWLCHYFMVQP